MMTPKLNKSIARLTAFLLLVSCSTATASIQLQMGDVVTATLMQSASIMGTGATTLSLYDNANADHLQETWNSSQAGLLGWTSVTVNGTPAPNFHTSCIEVLQDVYWGGTATFTVGDLATAPTQYVLNGLPGGMGNSANLIQALFDSHYQDAGTSNNNAGAFQIAIWKLVYDGPNVATNPNFSSGRLRAALTPEVSLATQWLTNLSGTSHSETFALTNPALQDQFYGSPAPEPASCLVWATLVSISASVGSIKRQRS